MQIPINKNSLASALTALGKLVSRTSLIKAYQGIEIEGKANMLYFRTRNVIEQIEFRLFADLEDDFPAILVEFEQFRQMVRSSKNKTLKLEIDCDEVFIDDVKLAPIKGHFPTKDQIPDQDITVTELPADTLSALSLLAPITDKGTDVRKILGGINISGAGFTATNGKELSNIPLKLETNGSVTIPFPLALLATKAFGESGRLSTWQKDEDTHFELTLGAWTWQAKALKGNYPNWKRIVPERTEATHYVSFQEDRAERLQRYLKSIPDDKEHNNAVKLSRLPEVPDNLHLESSNGMLFSILAEFDPNWNDLCFCVRKEFLLRLLDAGHRRIELNDAYGPIVGTGGSGQYIAMPIITKKVQAQNEQESEQVAPAQSDVKPEVQNEEEDHHQEVIVVVVTEDHHQDQEDIVIIENIQVHLLLVDQELLEEKEDIVVLEEVVVIEVEAPVLIEDLVIILLVEVLRVIKVKVFLKVRKILKMMLRKMKRILMLKVMKMKKLIIILCKIFFFNLFLFIIF